MTFFELLMEAATTKTRKTGELYGAKLGQARLSKAKELNVVHRTDLPETNR